MGRVIFLLEEKSMAEFLKSFLPRLIPGWREREHFLLVAHEGKTDLEKSIQRKLKAWREPGASFVIVRDNDRADCRNLKQHLLNLCKRPTAQVLVRLICQELEAWYLAQPDVLKSVYCQHTKAIERFVRRYPDPDECHKPSKVLMEAIPEFRKLDAARKLGQLLTIDCVTSKSFQVFVSGVRRLAGN